MSLELFAHNQQAYEAVTQMLALTGKAAVVHVDLTGDAAEDEGMVCGGIMDVLIQDVTE